MASTSGASRRIEERDGRDVGGSEVFGTANPERHMLAMPGTMLLPISPVPPFPLVVRRSHAPRFSRHGSLCPLRALFGESPEGTISL